MYAHGALCGFHHYSKRSWFSPDEVQVHRTESVVSILPACVGLPPLRDRSRVVPRSDSACVFTERFLRSENAGFTKSRRVIGEHVSHPLVGRSRYRGGKKPLNA